MADFPYKEILLLFLTTLTGYLVWRVQYQKDRLKTIESQLSDKKYRMYSELIHIYFDITYSSRFGKTISNEDIAKRFIEIKKDMFLYASDDIFKQFIEWSLKTNDNSVEHFKEYFRLITLIRKDMGNENTKIKLDDFMLFDMQNRDEYEKFKIDNKWN